jgi:hypothetical protein
MENESKPIAHPLNAPGDFYVENSMCITCGAPEREAPDLMSHVDDDGTNYHHCYFKRQPRTPEEIEQAIRAVRVGCCGAVRYGGHDPQIIKRLRFLGSADDCDHA